MTWEEISKELFEKRTAKRFTVPLKYSISHSKIQCDGTPLTNDELVRILNTNEGAFLENFNLKKENKELKEHEELFFKQVFDILLKYQDLFNREMADEVLEELGIELDRWFE